MRPRARNIGLGGSGTRPGVLFLRASAGSSSLSRWPGNDLTAEVGTTDLLASNGAVFTDGGRRGFLWINPHPTSDFQVIDCAASGFRLKSRLPVHWPTAFGLAGFRGS
jgi:hypothetical protein